MTNNKFGLREGIFVGLIAYAAVALFYSAFDFLAARGVLYTVDLLGRAAFRGLRDPSLLRGPFSPDLGAAFQYNAFHLVMSLAIGVFVTWLVGRASEDPSRSPVIVGVIATGFFVTVLFVAWMTAPLRTLLPLWSIALANAVAALLAGLFLLWRHPGLGRRLFSVERVQAGANR